MRAFVVFFLVDCDRAKGRRKGEESKASREMHNSLGGGGVGSPWWWLCGTPQWPADVNSRKLVQLARVGSLTCAAGTDFIAENFLA